MAQEHVFRADQKLRLDSAFVLTGGIGTGKSTAANLLSLYGYHVLDADKIVHALLETHTPDIVKLFSEDILSAGKIDRKKLSALVFANVQMRQKLEDFMHPRVRLEMLTQAQILEAYKQPYFLDIPLYYEIKGIESYGISQIVLVYAPRDLQIQRIAQRDRLELAQILQRINAQMDIEIKKSLSPFVLDNSRDLKHLQQEVDTFIQTLQVPKS